MFNSNVTALDGYSESQTQEEIAKDNIQLQRMAPYLNAVLRGQSLEASYEKVLSVIHSLQKDVWLPQIGDPNQRLI
uniref:Cytoplasmic protein n=1 Tax=Heterorhabditis bacteriophora TaxID=37862 RepID=A0A1I7X696_HETBA